MDHELHSKSTLNGLAQDEPQMISAVNWLGHGINFLARDAPDGWSLDKIQQGSYFVKHRPVRMSEETKTIKVGRPVTTPFKYPANLRVVDDEREATGNLKTWATGTEVVQTFNLDADLGVEYMGLGVEAGGGFNQESQYTSNKQYAFLSKTISSYNATFESVDQTKFIDPELLRDALALPDWDYSNSVTRDKYTFFFHTYGTHMVNFAGYGWRYQLECSQSNSDSEETASFYVNMAVKYQGYNAGVDYKQSEKYKKFDSESRASVKAIGGALNLANAVMDDPSDLEKKARWENEAGTIADEGLANLKMVPIAKIFDGLSPAATYRPVFLKLAESLFDLQKACYRTMTIDAYYFVSTDGSLTIDSNDANFMQTKGNTETDDKKRVLGVYGTSRPIFGGQFPIRCGRDPTVATTLQVNIKNSSNRIFESQPIMGYLSWDPKGDGKLVLMEKIQIWAGKTLVPDEKVFVNQAVSWHTKPGSGGEFWWLDRDAQ